MTAPGRDPGLLPTLRDSVREEGAPVRGAGVLEGAERVRELLDVEQREIAPEVRIGYRHRDLLTTLLHLIIFHQLSRD